MLSSEPMARLKKDVVVLESWSDPFSDGTNEGKIEVLPKEEKVILIPKFNCSCSLVASLINFSGRTVLQKECFGVKEEKIEFDLTSQPKGVYYLRLKLSDGGWKEKMIIKLED